MSVKYKPVRRGLTPYQVVLWILPVTAAVLFGHNSEPPPATEDRLQPGTVEEEPELPHFQLPFGDPPGPGTWYLVQPYGNTTLAYRERRTVYLAGQGLHFGVDLAARCGTQVLAIGDGRVIGIDVTYHGAGPHNLLIDHENGYLSLYGHLFARPLLEIDQVVKGGEVVARSGDPDLSCTSRPHLHLEIRDSATRTIAYNPISMIDAPWDRIVLFGPTPMRFEQDLEAPTQWQTMQDQPEIHFGHPFLNDFAAPWPPDW